VAPVAPERERSFHLIPALRLRAMYMIEDEEFEVEASLRVGLEVIAGTVGLVTVGGDPVPFAGVEAAGFTGIEAFEQGGLSGQVLLPTVDLAAIFDQHVILRAGSGLSGFRVSSCMGPIILAGQLRLPNLDVWMVADDDFQDPLISVGAMLVLGIAL
jgi:hypothetical protein